MVSERGSAYRWETCIKIDTGGRLADRDRTANGLARVAASAAQRVEMSQGRFAFGEAVGASPCSSTFHFAER